MSRFRAAPAGGRQTGKGVTIPAIVNGANTNVAVTFPQAYVNPPVVEISIIGTSRLNWGMVAGSVTITGFTVNFGNFSGANVGATSFDWVAVPA